MSKNQFGGSWTEAKMDIVVSYAKAYLTIMNKQYWAKTIYFDGFAGSGIIETDENDEVKKGTALRILDINDPSSFDIYYFVELNEEHKNELEKRVQRDYFGKNAHIVKANCNEKLIKMADFLKANKSYRALAFIDPYGMSVNWDSIEILKGLGIDLWILVPTGIGVGRLLKNNGEISKAWLSKLEKFLGLTKEEIISHFYKKHQVNTLFGHETIVEKEKDAVNKAGILYKERLNTVFRFVSDSFVMRNTTKSIMYHFMMATNNPNAMKIANDVIKPKYKL
ncbi:MAG TPA: three-Cys-motif partner protein TcmP [Chitinophagaceae bacterium]|nr:three-Cys-motif partner protein TcmP [Chitinophagaceae bacterium]